MRIGGAVASEAKPTFLVLAFDTAISSVMSGGEGCRSLESANSASIDCTSCYSFYS